MCEKKENKKPTPLYTIYKGYELHCLRIWINFFFHLKTLKLTFNIFITNAKPVRKGANHSNFSKSLQHTHTNIKLFSFRSLCTLSCILKIYLLICIFFLIIQKIRKANERNARTFYPWIMCTEVRLTMESIITVIQTNVNRKIKSLMTFFKYQKKT